MLSIAHADFVNKPISLHGENDSRASKRIPACALEPTVSDDALVQLIARGSRRAMQLLYMRHNVRVYRFILRLTKNACLAEDIVSETFLDVWRCAEGFRSRSQVSTWLLAIARNKVLSAFRRRVDEQLDNGRASAIEEPADGPEASLNNKCRSAAIQRCLAQFSASHREVLDLVYYHEKTIEEVAQIVGSPTGTVKTRMHYARQRMRDLLTAAGFDTL